jgi:predicted alpha/beta-hydrolase family hydrolase
MTLLHTAFFQPKKQPKATILFFHGAGGKVTHINVAAISEIIFTRMKENEDIKKQN